MLLGCIGVGHAVTRLSIRESKIASENLNAAKKTSELVWSETFKPAALKLQGKCCLKISPKKVKIFPISPPPTRKLVAPPLQGFEVQVRG